MKNKEVAELLNKVADYLELKEDRFKIRAYRRAALVVDSLSENIENVWKKDRLEDLPSIGEGISKTISDYLKDGKSKFLESLKKKTPVDMEQLGGLEGLGPKTILKLYKKLKIKNIKDLERAAKKGKLKVIEGLGEVVEKNILKSISFSKESKGRILLGDALPNAEEIVDKLRKLNYVSKVDICGSLRRMEETIGDIDILVESSKPRNIMEYFTKLRNVTRVLAKGKTKSSIIVDGIQVDLRIVESKSYGAALNYFTGNKDHNILLRRIAISKGLKLSEYGLFKKDKYVCGKTENEIYKKLGMRYIEPEIREGENEIELSKSNNLPKLIGYNEIKGDLQMHSTWSDGSNSIQEMAIAAKKLGHKYIAMTDHGGNLKIANAMDEKRIKKQHKEIDMVSRKIKFPILKGVEVDIKANGEVNLSKKVLNSFDIVVGSIHSGFKGEGTKRIVKAMENEYIDIIGHPSGRLINKREGVNFDIGEVCDVAKSTKTVLEINSYPDRLDLKDSHVKVAVDRGVKLVISTDSHSTETLNYLRYGVATARRGWAQKKDVINTRNLKEMMRMLK